MMEPFIFKIISQMGPCDQFGISHSENPKSLKSFYREQVCCRMSFHLLDESRCLLMASELEAVFRYQVDLFSPESLKINSILRGQDLFICLNLMVRQSEQKGATAATL